MYASAREGGQREAPGQRKRVSAFAPAIAGTDLVAANAWLELAVGQIQLFQAERALGVVSVHDGGTARRRTRSPHVVVEPPPLLLQAHVAPARLTWLRPFAARDAGVRPLACARRSRQDAG